MSQRSSGSDTSDYEDSSEEEIPFMKELRSLRYLELFHCEVTATGLTVILDKCTRLESLHVTGSFIGRMEDDLRERYDMLRELTLPARKLVRVSIF